MNSYLVISTSLNPHSKSRMLAKYLCTYLEEKGVSVKFLDLEQMPLPMCDAGAAYRDDTTQEVAAMVKEAQGILVATPIYNYNVNGALKNLVELTGAGWEDKVVGFMAAAGGQTSYMSLLPIMNSLMLDFRSILIPRFVYATKNAFDDEKVVDDDIQNRLKTLGDEVVRFTSALFPSS